MPWLGRWGSCDPIGITDSTNIFLYASSNPVKAADTTGKFVEEFYEDRHSLSVNENAITPMSPENIEKMSDEKRKEWYINKLAPYRDALNNASIRHNLPPQLLATVILNELADISLFDVIQDNIDVQNGSVGIAQIQISTAIDFGLVDVSEMEISDYQEKQSFSGGLDIQNSQAVVVKPSRDEALRQLTGEKLKNPEVAIEAVARRVGQLLVQALKNPNDFTNEFLIGSPASIDDIYSFVDDGGSNSQMNKERRLANLITAAYNSPDILIAKYPGDPFNIDKPGPYPNARIHGVNSRFISDDIFRFNLFRKQSTHVLLNNANIQP